MMEELDRMTRIFSTPGQLEIVAEQLARRRCFTEADQIFDVVLSATPYDPTLWWKRATNAVASGNFQQAQNAYLAAIDHYQPGQDPAFLAACWRGLARVYWQLGKPGEAVASVESMLSFTQENPWNWAFAGMVFEYAGALEKAKDAYQQALRLDPSLVSAQQGVERLETNVSLPDLIPVG